MAQFNFNVNDVQELRTFVHTPGVYRASIIRTTIKEPNAKGTQQLMLTWMTDSNEELNYSVTIICPTNPAAEQIGKRFLKQVCDAIGMTSFMDTNELIGKAHLISVKEGTPRLMPDGTQRSYLEVASVHSLTDTSMTPPPPISSSYPTWEVDNVSLSVGNVPPWQVK